MYLLDDQNNVHNINESEIICIEVSRPNVYYRTKHGKYKAPRTVNDHLLIYGPYHYAQIDKKKIVNMRLADKVENGCVHFGELNYPISIRKEQSVKNMMQNRSN